MSKQHIEELLHTAINQLQKTGELTVETPRIQIDTTKDKSHGDFASNIALMLAKPAQRKPRDVAEMIVKTLPTSSHITKVEIAGPGFINFFLSADAVSGVIADILQAGDQYGKANIGKNQRILVEFLSSNPTGPLHVGHGRHAAFGAVVSNLLDNIGYKTLREYYVNDAGRQMDILATSVWLRYLGLCGEEIIFPANGYKGDYVIEIAHQLRKARDLALVVPAADVFQDLPLDEPQGGDKEIYIDAVIARAKKLLGDANYTILFDISLNGILADIREDLSEFGVQFDSWFSERDFTRSDVVDKMLAMLKQKGLTYEQEGALWFKAMEFGDEKDRVLERSNGVRTYFTNDLAYHVNKFQRADMAIDIFGSDHHGYIPRMRAGMKACGISEEKLTYCLMQFVMLYRGGQQVQMSTRSGSFVTLRELREEVGNDAARFFYVMRRCTQPVDFDLDLAKSQSNENPVYYIQYAYARICSVFRQLAEKNLAFEQAEGLKHVTLLTEEHELQLLNTLAKYKDMLINAALQHEPHLLTNYLRELAHDFHTYYNAHQFLTEDTMLRAARLSLVLATRQILANGLKLLGVSTPESM